MSQREGKLIGEEAEHRRRTYLVSAAKMRRRKNRRRQKFQAREITKNMNLSEIENSQHLRGGDSGE